MITQGEIYLVDFGEKYNSEFGKRRPALIIQSNRVNRLLEKMQYQSVAVIPLSTSLIDDAFFRLRLEPRERLEKASDIVCNWVCTVDFARIEKENGVIATLSPKELAAVKAKLGVLVE
jgi:mRNA interferase MazF